MKRTMKAWIGVDLDGTLAAYDVWRGAAHIGEPVPLMLERVRRWLEDGRTVKIFTARVSSDGTPERDEEASIARQAIEKWCEEHLWQKLEVTCTKDYAMIELWDDRAVSVEENTGRRLAPSRRGLG